MNTNRVRYIHITASALGAGLALIVLLVALGGARTRAASPRDGTGNDPRIKAITVTSNLPISDTHPGDGITKTIYFGNAVPGVITLTFEISGTPTLTLMAGAAFNERERIYTATSSLMITDVVYTVSTTHGSQNHIVYTAANAVATTVAITYVRDITAPVTSMLISPISGTITNTCTVKFDWSDADDGSGSGIAGYNFKLGNIVYTTTDSYTQTACLDDKVYTWIVRAYDNLGLYSDYTDTWNLMIDTTPPLISSPVITEYSDDYLHSVDTHLFYTNTMGVGTEESFWIGGAASDEGSGLARVTFSPAFGDTPLEDTTPTAWQARYRVSREYSDDGVITATLYDRSGMTAFQLFTYTLDGTPPTSVLTTTTLESFGKVPVDIEWSAQDDGCGVESVDIYSRTFSSPWSPITTVTGLTGMFSFVPPTVLITGPITYEFASVATDYLGNIEELPDVANITVIVRPARLYLPLVVRNYPPQPVGSVVIERGDTNVYQRFVTLSLTATIASDEVEWIRISNDKAALYDELWEHISPTLALSLTESWELTDGISGLRTVYAQFKGSQGGISERVSDQIYLSWNGNFGDELNWWTPGGGLGVAWATDPDDPGNPVALLGDPAYSCAEGVPLDHASLSQTFAVPDTEAGKSVYVRFRYRIYSNDRNADLTDQYDSFDVLVNGALRFRDANRVYFDRCNVPPYDLGWQEGEFVLQEAGQSVKISFEVHNRFDHWYNTYVYLDDVRIVTDWTLAKMSN